MAIYTYVHAYATLDELQLKNECIAAGLPVIDVQREGDVNEHIDVITSRALTSPEQTTLGTTVFNHSSGLAPTAPIGNLLANAGFWFNQRNPAGAINDDSYVLDRWYLLIQVTGPQGGISQVVGARTNEARVLNTGSSSFRMGMAQILEHADIRMLRGQMVRLQFLARSSVGTVTLRYAVLEWRATADTVTSDVVNDWTSTTYTASNFFIPNCVPCGVGSTVLSTTQAEISLEVPVSNSCNNLIVFLWTEGPAAVGDRFEVQEIGLYANQGERPWQPFSQQAELARCQRYCVKLTGLDLGQAQQTSRVYQGGVLFPVTMFKVPTLYSGNFSVNSGSAGTVVLSNSQATGTGFANTANNWTVGALVTVTAVLDAEL